MTPRSEGGGAPQTGAAHGTGSVRRRMNTMPPALAPDRLRHPRRVFAITLGAGVLAMLALASGASADFLTPPSGGSPNADDIDTLYKIVLAVAVVVFVGVEGVLLYSLIRFRARKDAVPAQIRGNTRLEIGWTIGASVILVVLAAVTFGTLDGIRNPPNSDASGFPTAKVANVDNASAFQPRTPNGRALNIKVNGQRYAWRYTYPDLTPTDNKDNVFSYEEMVVPTQTTVTLDIEAQDVAHSWWIPQLGGKFDAVPGHTNFTWFKIPRPGIYKGQCAELCGRNHADMVAQVRAISPADFKVWLAQKKSEITAADKLAEARRKQIAAGNDAPSQTATTPQSAPDQTTGSTADTTG
jgi:cytochrome c oxidase subunit 2